MQLLATQCSSTDAQLLISDVPGCMRRQCVVHHLISNRIHHPQQSRRLHGYDAHTLSTIIRLPSPCLPESKYGASVVCASSHEWINSACSTGMNFPKTALWLWELFMRAKTA